MIGFPITAHLITQISQNRCDNHLWQAKDPTYLSKDNQSTIWEVIQSTDLPILQHQKTFADLVVEKPEGERKTLEKPGQLTKGSAVDKPENWPFSMAASSQMKFIRVQPTKRMEIQLSILLPFAARLEFPD